MIELIVDGRPHGKGRPRFDSRTKRTYTDRPTELAEARVERAWEQAGKPRIVDGAAIVLRVEVVVARPQAHWRRDGTLSAAGEREPLPRKKPDLDNAVKLLMDALNGKAYRDDVDVAHLHAVRRWANPGEGEHCAIQISAWPREPGVLERVA